MKNVMKQINNEEFCNPSVTGIIPSFARRGRGGFDYFS
jgi:hypothetical protein